MTLLTTGCLRLTAQITVEENGTAHLEAISAVDPEQILELSVLVEQAAGAAPSTVEEVCVAGEALTTFDFGGEVADFDEDGMCGSRVAIDFENPGELSSTLAAGVGAVTLSGASVEGSGQAWRFGGVLELADIGVDVTQLSALPIDGLLDDVEVWFEIELPGKAADHNADEVSGGRFRWNLDPTTPQRTLTATTTPAGSSGNGLVVAAIVTAVLVAALLGGWALWRHTRSL